MNATHAYATTALLNALGYGADSQIVGPPINRTLCAVSVKFVFLLLQNHASRRHVCHMEIVEIWRAVEELNLPHCQVQATVGQIKQYLATPVHD